MRKLVAILVVVLGVLMVVGPAMADRGGSVVFSSSSGAH
jgi:hypothetical protein